MKSDPTRIQIRKGKGPRGYWEVHFFITSSKHETWQQAWKAAGNHAWFLREIAKLPHRP